VPTYEYRCNRCDETFEELLLDSDDIKSYAREHPCPSCKQPALRVPSAANFSFSAPARATAGSGVHGQSGSHDLDYPSLDKAVGRSASKKWTEYDERKAVRDKVRKEAGTNSVTVAGDTAVPSDSKVLDARAKGLRTWSRARKEAG
jgi:putative FmdB family regulatory protein